jgi:ATP-dependent RNA helicase RhlE
LDPKLLRAIDRRGYAQATAIQQQAIPVALRGRDILGCAQTGTGKTAAFALPILQHLTMAEGQCNDNRRNSNDPQSSSTDRPQNRVRPIRSLILVPTRELAAQVAESFASYGQALGLRQTTIFGGVSARPQLDALRRGVDLVVATPGRLLDLHSQGFVKLDQVQVLVLDEADQMFDMGFIRDVRKIIRALPRNRQTMLFSATLPDQIRQLARECLTDPVSISVDPGTVTPDKIEQQVHYLRTDEKPSALIEFLQQHARQRTLVFCRTKHGAGKIVRKLQAAHIAAVAIHGNKSQNARQAALRTFNSPQPPILVATDVAARGLHLPDVKIVINYELSDTPETYVHRIGRTARAEASGRAVTFCAPEERSLLLRIQKLTKVRLATLSETLETTESLLVQSQHGAQPGAGINHRANRKPVGPRWRGPSDSSRARRPAVGRSGSRHQRSFARTRG